jgi:hypothetical protein
MAQIGHMEAAESLWSTWVQILKGYEDQAYVSFINFGLADRISHQSASYFTIIIRKCAIHHFKQWSASYNNILVRCYELYNNPSSSPETRIYADNVGKMISNIKKILQYQIDKHISEIHESESLIAASDMAASSNFYIRHEVNDYVMKHVIAIKSLNSQIKHMFDQCTSTIMI